MLIVAAKEGSGLILLVEELGQVRRLNIWWAVDGLGYLQGGSVADAADLASLTRSQHGHTTQDRSADLSRWNLPLNPSAS